MPTLDDIWTWVYQPFTDTTDYRKSNPGRDWSDVRGYLLDRLGLRDSTDRPFTDDLFRQLDEMPEDDRRVLLEDKDKFTAFGYEIAQRYAEEPRTTPRTQQATENSAAYDPSAWQAFLAENGSRWDGTEASWAQFETWFRYEADRRGFGYPATGLFGYLAGQPVADRIATLKQYGVPITAPARQRGRAEFTDADMAALLAEQPDLAKIPEERRREIIADMLDELNS